MATSQSPPKKVGSRIIPFDIEQLRSIEELPELEDLQTPKITFLSSKSHSTCVSTPTQENRPVMIKSKYAVVRPKQLLRFDSGDYFADKEMTEVMSAKEPKMQ